MTVTCEYCRRSQSFEKHNGGCETCGAPLPKPKPDAWLNGGYTLAMPQSIAWVCSGSVSFRYEPANFDEGVDPNEVWNDSVRQRRLL